VNAVSKFPFFCSCAGVVPRFVGASRYYQLNKSFSSDYGQAKEANRCQQPTAMTANRDETGMPVRDGTSMPVWRDGTSTPVWRDGTSTPARWDGTSTPARPDEPAQLPHGSAGPAEPAQPQGLAWWWEIDLDALLGGLNADSPAREGAQPTCPQPEEDQEAVLAAELAARDRNTARTVPAGEVAGRVAERLSQGPGLAALLSGVPAGELSDHDLPAVAAGFRRIASWAQASELSAGALPVAVAGRRRRRVRGLTLPRSPGPGERDVLV